MSRKDYRAIAQALVEAKNTVELETSSGLNKQARRLYGAIAIELSRAMKRDNHNFDSFRFFDASDVHYK